MTRPEPNLTKFEEAALALGRLNERDFFKRLQQVFLHSVNRPWMRSVVNRRSYVDGIDWLLDLEPDRGVVLAANHRSFFDQYIALLNMYECGVSFPRRLYFPVRANFFYDRPIGVLLNMLIGGGAMYPPIYRDRTRADLNRDALERLTHFLQDPTTLVGMHPEGRRGKGDDPYELLPAQPGIGEVILRAKPLVIPLFIGGLTNDFLGQAVLNYHHKVRQKRPLIFCFGEPVDYSKWTEEKPRLALYKRTADAVRDAIVQLGERERTIREACLSGRVSNGDPNWLINRIRARRRGKPHARRRDPVLASEER